MAGNKVDTGWAVDPYNDGINEVAEEMYRNTQPPAMYLVSDGEIGGVQVTDYYQTPDGALVQVTV